MCTSGIFSQLIVAACVMAPAFARPIASSKPTTMGVNHASADSAYATSIKATIHPTVITTHAPGHATGTHHHQSDHAYAFYKGERAHTKAHLNNVHHGEGQRRPRRWAARLLDAQHRAGHIRPQHEFQRDGQHRHRPYPSVDGPADAYAVRNEEPLTRDFGEELHARHLNWNEVEGAVNTVANVVGDGAQVVGTVLGREDADRLLARDVEAELAARHANWNKIEGAVNTVADVVGDGAEVLGLLNREDVEELFVRDFDDKFFARAPADELVARKVNWEKVEGAIDTVGNVVDTGATVVGGILKHLPREERDELLARAFVEELMGRGTKVMDKLD